MEPSVKEKPDHTKLMKDYEDRLEEINRRSQVVEEYKKKGDQSCLDFTVPLEEYQKVVGKVKNRVSNKHQNYALINLAHLSLRPKSESPAFRILGVFNTIEELKEYGLRIRQQVPIDIRCISLHDWTIIPVFDYDDESRERLVQKLQQILQNHYKEQREANVDYSSNKNEKTIGKTHQSLEKKIENAQKKLEKSKKKVNVNAVLKAKVRQEVSTGGLKKLGPYPSNFCIANQSFAVISILRDNTSERIEGSKSPEPLFRISGVFATESQAESFIKDEISFIDRLYHYDVVNMYEWLYIEDVNFDQVKTEYRETELNNIMEQRKSEQKRVTKFKDYDEMNQNDLQTRVVEVKADFGESKEVRELPPAMNVEVVEEKWEPPKEDMESETDLMNHKLRYRLFIEYATHADKDEMCGHEDAVCEYKYTIQNVYVPIPPIMYEDLMKEKVGSNVISMRDDWKDFLDIDESQYGHKFYDPDYTDDCAIDENCESRGVVAHQTKIKIMGVEFV